MNDAIYWILFVFIIIIIIIGKIKDIEEKIEKKRKRKKGKELLKKGQGFKRYKSREVEVIPWGEATGLELKGTSEYRYLKQWGAKVNFDIDKKLPRMNYCQLKETYDKILKQVVIAVEKEKTQKVLNLKLEKTKKSSKFYHMSVQDELGGLLEIVEVITGISPGKSEVITFRKSGSEGEATYYFLREVLSEEEIYLRLENEFKLSRFDVLLKFMQAFRDELSSNLEWLQNTTLKHSPRFFASDDLFAILSDKEVLYIYSGVNSWAIDKGSFLSLIPSNMPIKLNMFKDLFFSFQEVFYVSDLDKILKDSSLKEIKDSINISGVDKMLGLYYDYLREVNERIHFFEQSLL